MHETHHDSWDGETVFATIAVTDATDLRDNRERCALTVTIGNTDLPAFLSNGVLYVQAPLGLFFEAFAENVSEFIRDMEIRVSTKGGRALSLDGDGRPVPGARVAKPRVVRSGRKS